MSEDYFDNQHSHFFPFCVPGHFGPSASSNAGHLSDRPLLACSRKSDTIARCSSYNDTEAALTCPVVVRGGHP